MKPGATDRQLRAARALIDAMVEPVVVPMETCPECGDGYVQVPDPSCHHLTGNCGCGGDEVEVDCPVCHNLRVRVCDDGVCALDAIDGKPGVARMRIGTGVYCRDCVGHGRRTEEECIAEAIAESFPDLFAAADLLPAPRRTREPWTAQPA